MTPVSTRGVKPVLGSLAGRSKALLAESRQPAISLLAWVYLYVVGLLGAWVLLAVLLTSWQPVVITTGSMQPSLRPGDVLLVSVHPEEPVAQRTVITYRSAEDPDTLITHRVFAVEANGYVTKGDANPTPDTDRVAFSSVDGVGRVVVPLIGLPLVWIGNGNLVALVAWIIVSLVAAVVAVSRLDSLIRFGPRSPTGRSGSRPPSQSRSQSRSRLRSRSSSRLRSRAAARGDRASPVAEKAIRRVRILIGVIVGTQYFIDASRFDIEGSSVHRWQLLTFSLVVLTALNLLSIKGGRTPNQAVATRLSLIQLVGDTLLVLLLTMGTGTDGIGWVLFALPIVEAAARYRLAGALIHWMLLTGLTIASRIWVLERTAAGSSALIEELERVLDQLSVLLLVVIPGAHLAEQLVGDVLRQRQATVEAVERGLILERVAETGHELNRLGGALFSTVTEAALDHGFGSSDVCLRVDGGRWQVVERRGAPDLPSPESPGSGLNPRDDALAELLIDEQDPDPSEWAALADAGFASLARIIVSRQEGTSVAVRAATVKAPPKQGAIDAFRLMCGQTGVALQNQRLLDELRLVHDALAHQAAHDPLTGLPNRARFLELLRTAVDARVNPTTDDNTVPAPDDLLAVFFLDLDGFKAVNDDLGHDIGDGLLLAVARRLSGAVDDTAVVARLGGDEFTVLVTDETDRTAVEELAEQVRMALVEPYRIGGEYVIVGASLGVAYHEDRITADELIRRADAAMYDAKARQAPPFNTIYHPALDLAEHRRTDLTGDFPRALDGDELQMQYQPILATADGLIIGAEALLRWRHPTHGWVDPGSIFSAAEANGLIDVLTAWILDRSTTEAARWSSVSGNGLFVAVNASPHQLDSGMLDSHIAGALTLSGLSAANLVLELNESVLTDEAGFVARLKSLTDLGVALAVDNFGVGRSSLPHLHGLPMSVMKLGRVLVQQSTRSPADRVIVESICALASRLGLVVVAEGVETPEQLEVVRQAGAELAQGFLFHRAMSSSEFATLLRRQADKGSMSSGWRESVD